jgi:hypothetical protein
MLPDRLVGALCVGLAALAATWGGNTTWRAPHAWPRQAAAPASQRGAAGPSSEASTTTAAGGTTGMTLPTEAAVAPTTTIPGSSTTTTVGRSTGPAGEPAKAKAMARQALLVVGDLPSGFVTLRAAPGDDDPTTDGPFERCLGADAGALTAAIRAKAASAQFARTGTGTASSSSAVFDQTAPAERVMGILGSSPARSCFEGLINARLARNPNLPENVRGTLASIDAEQAGDQTTGFRFEVKLPAEDVVEDPDPSEDQVSYLADFVFVRRGRVLALVELANLRHPFDAGLAQGLLSSLAKHMPSA